MNSHLVKFGKLNSSWALFIASI